jgi:transposase
MKYRTFGDQGLLCTTKNKSYPKSVKIQAVEEYLNGKGSLFELCSKYEIPSRSVLQNGLNAIMFIKILNLIIRKEMFI